MTWHSSPTYLPNYYLFNPFSTCCLPPLHSLSLYIYIHTPHVPPDLPKMNWLLLFHYKCIILYALQHSTHLHLYSIQAGWYWVCIPIVYQGWKMRTLVWEGNERILYIREYECKHGMCFWERKCVIENAVGSYYYVCNEVIIQSCTLGYCKERSKHNPVQVKPNDGTYK